MTELLDEYSHYRVDDKVRDKANLDELINLQINLRMLAPKSHRKQCEQFQKKIQRTSSQNELILIDDVSLSLF